MPAPRLSLLPVILLVLGVITLSEGLRMARGKRCCTSFTRGRPIKEVVSYTWTSRGCLNRALLLKTTAGRQLCARPSDAWVQRIVSALDNRIPGDQSPLQ